MPRSSVYTYKIENSMKKIKSVDLIEDFSNLVKNLELDKSTDDYEDWRGFIPISRNDDTLVNKDGNILMTKYGLYRRTINKNPYEDSEYSYYLSQYDVWFNLETRIIQIYSSDAAVYGYIQDLIETNIEGVTLGTVNFEESFIRWVIENIRKRDKLFPGTHLISAPKVKVRDLDQYDIVQLASHDELLGSDLYEKIYLNTLHCGFSFRL